METTNKLSKFKLTQNDIFPNAQDIIPLKSINSQVPVTSLHLMEIDHANDRHCNYR